MWPKRRDVPYYDTPGPLKPFHADVPKPTLKGFCLSRDFDRICVRTEFCSLYTGPWSVTQSGRSLIKEVKWTENDSPACPDC